VLRKEKKERKIKKLHQMKMKKENFNLLKGLSVIAFLFMLMFGMTSCSEKAYPYADNYNDSTYYDDYANSDYFIRMGIMDYRFRSMYYYDDWYYNSMYPYSGFSIGWAPTYYGYYGNRHYTYRDYDRDKGIIHRDRDHDKDRYKGNPTAGRYVRPNRGPSIPGTVAPSSVSNLRNAFQSGRPNRVFITPQSAQQHGSSNIVHNDNQQHSQPQRTSSAPPQQHRAPSRSGRIN
jgi:hypothetical protein